MNRADPNAYIPSQKCKWPSKEKEYIRNENPNVELTKFKRVRKYDNFFEYTSGYEVDRQHRSMHF